MYTEKPTKEVAVSLYDWSFLETYILNLVRESYFRPLLPREHKLCIILITTI